MSDHDVLFLALFCFVFGFAYYPIAHRAAAILAAILVRPRRKHKARSR